MPRHDKRTIPSPRLWISDHYVALLRTHGLDSAGALFDFADGELLTKPGLGGWRERLRLTLGDGQGASVLYMKRFTTPPRRARRELRKARSGAATLAGNEWEWINRLRAAGIPCPTPVAFAEELHRGIETRSFLLLAAVSGKSLEGWARETPPLARSIVQSLISSTAALVRHLHRAGYVHRDLYLSHLFFEPQRDALCLIDLQRVLRPTWRFERWRVKDLAALNHSTPAHLVSRSDRMRWLLFYLDAKKLDSAGKRLAYRVIGKTRSIARRDRGRVSP